MKKRFLKSLKAQLPFSFAAIALITTTMIGAVLYFIIWNYYTGLETGYLNSNITGMANNLTRIAENSDIDIEDSLSDYQGVFQNQVRITAFLIKSRVKILDRNYEVISDSGSPSRSWNITIPRLLSEDGQSGDSEHEEEDSWTLPDQPAKAPANSSDDGSDKASSFSLEPGDGQQSGCESSLPYSFQANPILFGYQLEKGCSL